MWAVAVRTLGDPDEAADAVQDACLSAYRAAASFRGDSRVSTWLHRIVVNACLDRARRRAVRPTVPLPEQPMRRPARPARPSARSALGVHDALQALPEDQRLAIVLVDLEGFSVDDAAAVLGVPAGTVKSRCFRGRARLAVSLGYLRNPDGPGRRHDLRPDRQRKEASDERAPRPRPAGRPPGRRPETEHRASPPGRVRAVPRRAGPARAGAARRDVGPGRRCRCRLSLPTSTTDWRAPCGRLRSRPAAAPRSARWSKPLAASQRPRRCRSAGLRRHGRARRRRQREGATARPRRPALESATKTSSTGSAYRKDGKLLAQQLPALLAGDAHRQDRDGAPQVRHALEPRTPG